MYTLRGQKSTRGGDTVTFWQVGVESKGETAQNPAMALSKLIFRLEKQKNLLG
jgi:hypothetical protein